MIAAVSNRGLMRFKLYKGALNVAIFIGFMKRLIKDAKQKVFLIVGNLRVHHAKAVQQWLAQHQDEIEIFRTKQRRRPANSARPSSATPPQRARLTAYRRSGAK